MLGNMNEARLFTLTADGSTPQVLVLEHSQMTVFVGGTFGGATVLFEVSPVDGGEWFVVESFTEAGVKNICFDSYSYRFTVSGAGTTTIDAYVRVF